MKPYALLIYNLQYKLLYSHYNLEDIFLLYRWYAKNKIEELAGELIKTATVETYYKINEKRDDVELTIYGHASNNYYILITDKEYPARIAFKLLTVLKNTTDLNEDIVNNLWDTYQSPNHIDSITQIKTDIDETKLILLDSIDKLLVRGEKIDDLLNKTNELTERSFLFNKRAKETNKCCMLI